MTHTIDARLTTPSGFTLIEVLIVIGVIVILATMGINSYSSARQAVITDIQSDTLISQLHSLRDKAQTKQRCFGMYFAPSTAPQIIEAPFLDPRRGCDVKDKSTVMMWDKLAPIDGLWIDADEQENLTIWFAPPAGKLIIAPVGQSASVRIANRTSQATSLRTVQLTTSTGTFEKILPARIAQ